jgi:hypothetical protein
MPNRLRELKEEREMLRFAICVSDILITALIIAIVILFYLAAKR